MRFRLMPFMVSPIESGSAKAVCNRGDTRRNQGSVVEPT